MAAMGRLHKLLDHLGPPEINPIVDTLGLNPDPTGASSIEIYHPLFCTPDLSHLALHGFRGHKVASFPREPVVVADEAESGGTGPPVGTEFPVGVGWHHQALRLIVQLQTVPRAHRKGGPFPVGRANGRVGEVSGGAPGPAVVGAGDLAQPCHIDLGVELVMLRDLPGDGNEEEEEGPRFLVIQGTWIHGPVALQLGLGHLFLSVPLNVRRGRKTSTALK